MAKVTIDYDKCDGADCAECADVCPMEVLVLEGEKIEIVNPAAVIRLLRKNAIFLTGATIFLRLCSRIALRRSRDCESAHDSRDKAA